MNVQITGENIEILSSYEHDSTEQIFKVTRKIHKEQVTQSIISLVHKKLGYIVFVRKDQNKFVKDIKVLPSPEGITQHAPLIRDFKIRKK